MEMIGFGFGLELGVAGGLDWHLLDRHWRRGIRMGVGFGFGLELGIVVGLEQQ